ncbi:MAG: hypothetical protein AB7W28_08065 [Armatimonadota bacterium]
MVWFVVTLLFDFRRAANLYCTFMHMEQTFRDLKSPLGPKHLRLRSARRVQVLLVVIVTAYSFLFLLGVIASRSDVAARFVCGETSRMSFVFLATALIASFPDLLDLRLTHLQRLFKSGKPQAESWK